MKILLLNGASQSDSASEQACKIVGDSFRGTDHELVVMNLAQMKIDSCLGCFGCWMKTPGVCVIDDAGREVAKAVVQSDLVIALNTVTFGGYSSEMKKAVDRLIPIISPFFHKVNGETHHRPRYDCYPRWITIGLMAEADDEMGAAFEQIVARVAMHFHCPAHTHQILLHSQISSELAANFAKLLQEVGVEL